MVVHARCKAIPLTDRRVSSSLLKSDTCNCNSNSGVSSDSVLASVIIGEPGIESEPGVGEKLKVSLVSERLRMSPFEFEPGSGDIYTPGGATASPIFW